MNNKRPLVPSFIQHLDDKLLLEKPGVWSSRTHLVAWFVALYAVMLSSFCYLAFFDARQNSNIGGWVTFVILISLIGFICWLIYLLRFNVFKRYGNWLPWDGLKMFILYFLSIGMIVGVCFLPVGIQTLRANQQFGNEEIAKDINKMNTIICQLEYNQLPKAWKPDTAELVKPVKRKNINDAPTNDTTVITDTVAVAETYRERYRTVDSTDLKNSLLSADSMVKISDSLYVFYKSPVYMFAYTYDADEFTHTKLMRSAELYRKVVRPHHAADQAALQQEMAKLSEKYSDRSGDNYYSSGYGLVDDDGRTEDYKLKIYDKYHLDFINSGLRNAVQKKYEWRNNWSTYLRVFYYFTIVFTLLVFIFRHTTVRTFFFTLLAAVILAIFTGLITVVSYGDETTVFSFIVVYYIAFLALALSVKSNQKRTAVQGIGLNLFVFCTPFMPLVFVAIDEAMRRHAYDNPYQERYDYQQQALYYLVAEFAGGIILLVLIEPVFRRLYRKWYAAPEE
ncbi:MAG: hypothetical protein JST86_06910 [Bacteroidetes bacterium]|nr:hypothetical protein [Bacteroidota bacterium]